MSLERLGSEWTAEQQALWDGFSRDFQAHFERWTIPAAEGVAGALDLASGTRVLEVGCGAGGAAARLAGGLPAHVDWTALDLSPEMVALAAAALGERGTVLQGSAEALPFDDGAFDRLISNLCLMLVADPVQALAEARRVLRSGGRAGWTVWGRVAHSPMMTLVGDACEALAIDVPAPPRNNFHLGEGDALVQLVRAAGFASAEGSYHPMALALPSGHAFAQEMLYTGQRRKAWMASLGADVETALVDEVARRADAVTASGRSLCLDMLQVVATA